eukprot:snap_masked-scaffold_8-processed-gene-2.45-mRNA-1 protein AED:1.00 eAED:1.00 QI:0/0/0/0/1/1/2/0/440
MSSQSKLCEEYISDICKALSHQPTLKLNLLSLNSSSLKQYDFVAFSHKNKFRSFNLKQSTRDTASCIHIEVKSQYLPEKFRKKISDIAYSYVKSLSSKPSSIERRTLAASQKVEVFSSGELRLKASNETYFSPLLAIILFFYNQILYNKLFLCKSELNQWKTKLIKTEPEINLSVKSTDINGKIELNISANKITFLVEFIISIEYPKGKIKVKLSGSLAENVLRHYKNVLEDEARKMTDNLGKHANIEIPHDEEIIFTKKYVEGLKHDTKILKVTRDIEEKVNEAENKKERRYYQNQLKFVSKKEVQKAKSSKQPAKVEATENLRVLTVLLGKAISIFNNFQSAKSPVWKKYIFDSKESDLVLSICGCWYFRKELDEYIRSPPWDSKLEGKICPTTDCVLNGRIVWAPGWPKGLDLQKRYQKDEQRKREEREAVEFLGLG